MSCDAAFYILILYHSFIYYSLEAVLNNSNECLEIRPLFFYYCDNEVEFEATLSLV